MELEAVGRVQVTESKSARTRGAWQEELRGLSAQRNMGGGGMCRCPGAQPCVMTVTYQAGGGGGKLEGGLEKT